MIDYWLQMITIYDKWVERLPIRHDVKGHES